MNKVFPLALILLSLNVQAQNLKDPVYNFDYLWNMYKDHYKMFKVKHVDWDSLYKVYRPMLNHKSSDKKLFSVLSQLMYHLNDSHCWLDDGKTFYKSGTDVTYSHASWSEYWNKYHIGNFSLSVIENNYIVHEEFKTLQDGNFQYGWLADSIGYFHFGEFKETLGLNAVMDSILMEFQSAKGIIIDIRSNAGGQASVPLILNRFADCRRLYSIVDSNAYYLYKGDAKYNKKVYMHMEPKGKYRFTKPIVILTARTSYSSADLLATGFKEMAHTTIIGDTTNGCTSNSYMLHLPNGWGYTIAMGISYTASGVCLDGIGVAPDIHVTNSNTEIAYGRDRMLERGVQEIKHKTFYRIKDLDYSILLVRPPQIGEIFINLLEEGKTEMALQYLTIMYDQYPQLCEETVSEEMISEIAWAFVEAEQYEAGLKVFILNHRIFPYSPNTLFNIGECYKLMGDTENMLYFFKEVKKMDPVFRSNYDICIDDYLVVTAK